MRHNGERRPEEIQAEIARTRGDMAATLTAIEQRLTPGQLVDQGLDYLRNSGARQYVSNLGESVKSNPIPLALMGIGMAWLMATGNRRPSSGHESSFGSASSGPGMMERASEGMSSAKDRLSQTTQSAKERVGQIGQAARERVGQLGQTARGQMELVREQPLALGAIGFAIGALMAAGLPRTRQEDELMGEASDRLAEKAKQVGSEQLEKVKQAAGAASAGMQPQPRTSGKPNVIEPARATPVGGVTPRDPWLGTP